jgi:site-specific recombinase XerD
MVFPGYAQPQVSNSIRERFSNLMQRAGIQDFRFHDMRHAFASHLVMPGVPLHTVGQLLGHKTPSMTMPYAHLSSKHLKESVEMLPRWERSDKSATKAEAGG